MPRKKIKLGDQVYDITAKVTGIAIGHIEYLDGNKAWLIQPPYLPDGSSINTIEVEEAYAIWAGEGVYSDAKPIIGFHVGEE